MARPERFELPTYCSGGNRSIQLSYGRASTTKYIVLQRVLHAPLAWAVACLLAATTLLPLSGRSSLTTAARTTSSDAGRNGYSWQYWDAGAARPRPSVTLR